MKDLLIAKGYIKLKDVYVKKILICKSYNIKKVCLQNRSYKKLAQSTMDWAKDW